MAARGTTKNLTGGIDYWLISYERHAGTKFYCSSDMYGIMHWEDKSLHETHKCIQEAEFSPYM